MGFEYDPFFYFNAAEDPRLGEYIVNHHVARVAWGDTPAVIFAPAGGGKTSLRIDITRSAWVSAGYLHPLPVPYIPAQLTRNGRPPTSEEHLQDILHAIASTLLIVVAYFPQLLLAQTEQYTARLVELWRQWLQRPLVFLVDTLAETLSANQFGRLLDPTYLIASLPTVDKADSAMRAHHALSQLVATIRSHLTSAEHTDRPTQGRSVSLSQLQASLEEMIQAVRQLGFKNIHLEVDGADGLPETINDPEAAAQQVRWLLQQAPDWERRGLCVKAFLPIETEDLLNLSAEWQKANIVWTPDLLSEVIRRRVYRATGGKFGSLDAISSPVLRDVDTYLAQQVVPLPREVIMLVRLVLQAMADRTQGSEGRIESEDLDAAMRAYAKNRALIADVTPLPSELLRNANLILSNSATLNPNIFVSSQAFSHGRSIR